MWLARFHFVYIDDGGARNQKENEWLYDFLVGKGWP